MRKMLIVLLIAAAAVFLCTAALADTVVPLAPAPGNATLKDGRTILTAENLEKHNDLLRQLGVTKEDMLADWQARGVVAQAWSAIMSKYTCIEISVVQDSESAQFGDLMNSTDKAAWKSYKAAVKGSEFWAAGGYTVQSVEQKRAKSNSYLLIKYKMSGTERDHRGYMARTVFRGYTVTVDFQIYNRQFVKQDATDVFNVMKTIAAVQEAAADIPEGTGDGTESGDGTGAAAAPAQQKADLTISDGPPKETNTGAFTVTGVTTPGAEVLCVLMRITSNEPLLFKTTSHSRNGKFSVKIALPEEDYWTMTMEVSVDDKRVADAVFDTIQYKKTLIPVTYNNEIPETLAGNELKISGKTIKGVQIQCLVTRPQDTWQKTITTNGTGRFSFTIPTKEEGEYDVTLVFTKKGFETKNPSYTIYRNMSEEDRRVKIRKEAVRVGYTTLVSRIDQYVSKTMAFNNLYVTDIEQVGDEWKISVACNKVGDVYTQPMIFMAETEPAFAVDEQHNFFGKCKGPYLIQSEEYIESIPSFDLLFWD